MIERICKNCGRRVESCDCNKFAPTYGGAVCAPAPAPKPSELTAEMEIIRNMDGMTIVVGGIGHCFDHDARQAIEAALNLAELAGRRKDAAEMLDKSNSYVTNDATRNFALASAFDEGVKAEKARAEHVRRARMELNKRAGVSVRNPYKEQK